MTNAEIDHAVNMYLTFLTDPSNDCGWRGNSIHARMVDFKGMPPPPSRMDKSNEAMINAIRGLKIKPEIFWTIDRLVKRATQGPDKEKHSHQVTALLSKFYYQGLWDKPIGEGKTKTVPYDDEERGRRIGQSLAEFRFNVKAGYRYFRRRL